MENQFKSKVDWWFHLAMALYAVCMAALFVASSYAQPPVHSLCALTFVVMLVFFLTVLLPSYLFTRYIFEPGGLRIRSGWGRGRTIPYCDILACGPQSGRANYAAALSKDRLTVTYRWKNVTRTIHISPKEKEAFMGELDARKKGKPDQ